MTTKTMKITDRVFKGAVTEICQRYHDAHQRWSTYQVRSHPMFNESDLRHHRELWNQVESAKENISSLTTGLLGLLPAAELNDRMRRMVPELLEAAANRKRLKVKISRNK